MTAPLESSGSATKREMLPAGDDQAQLDAAFRNPSSKDVEVTLPLHRTKSPPTDRHLAMGLPWSCVRDEKSNGRQRVCRPLSATHGFQGGGSCALLPAEVPVHLGADKHSPLGITGEADLFPLRRSQFG